MKLLKYLSWILLVPLDFISMILAVILAPFVVPFYNKKTGKLPFGFDWMMTYDNPIDGDRGHIKRWEKIRKWPLRCLLPASGLALAKQSIQFCLS